jgi:hypothetical protein
MVLLTLGHRAYSKALQTSSRAIFLSRFNPVSFDNNNMVQGSLLRMLCIPTSKTPDMKPQTHHTTGIIKITQFAMDFQIDHMVQVHDVHTILNAGIESTSIPALLTPG